MRIMGIDPGLHITGYGIINTTGNQINLVEAGCIKTDARQAMSQRIETIYKEICEIIEEFHPEYYPSRISIPLPKPQNGHHHGACPWYTFSGSSHLSPGPGRVFSDPDQKSLSGYGHASKQQMQRMVQAP
jgi:crossover junction endodeoxyribonuclease RuvC